jgi:hypothetical protein
MIASAPLIHAAADAQVRAMLASAAADRRVPTRSTPERAPWAGISRTWRMARTAMGRGWSQRSRDLPTTRVRDRGRALVGTVGIALLLGSGVTGTAASGPAATADPGFAPRHGWTLAALERADGGTTADPGFAPRHGWMPAALGRVGS